MKMIPTSGFPISVPSFPVIRIDFKGRILYANKASFPILREWNCLANDYLPEELVHQYPAVLDLEAAFDILIETNGSAYFLDVIGFKESGYVGLYGFKTVANTNSSPQRKALTVQ
jgi:hypothetical protein